MGSKVMSNIYWYFVSLQ